MAEILPFKGTQGGTPDVVLGGKLFRFGFAFTSPMQANYYIDRWKAKGVHGFWRKKAVPESAYFTHFFQCFLEVGPCEDAV